MLLLKIMDEEVKSQGKVKTKSQLVLGTNYYLDRTYSGKKDKWRGGFLGAPSPPFSHPE